MKIYGELPEPGSLDWALVVPAFREGDEVFDTLHSGLTQRQVDPEKIAVFVVVNNARDASAEVLQSNAKTIDLVRTLQWHMSFEVDGDAYKTNVDLACKIADKPDVASFNIQLYNEIVSSKVRLILIDISTEGHAPEVCNVGLAKNLGGNMAADALKDDGILTITDADTLVGQHHARTLIDAFDKDPDLAGLRAIYNSFSIDDEGMFSRELSQHKWALFHLVDGFIKATSLHYEQEPFVLMGGANINVRASVFKDLKGIEHIPGAEDMKFSMKILDRNLKIGNNANLSYQSRERPSDRTEEGCGAGYGVIENLNYVDDYGKAIVDTFKENQFVTFMIRGVQGANFVTKDEETWRRMVKRASPDVELENDDVDALWEARMKAPNVNEVVNHWYLTMCIEGIAKKYFEKTTLYDETVATYERIKSSELVSPTIKGLIDLLGTGLIKINTFREGLSADEERIAEATHGKDNILYGIGAFRDLIIHTSVMRKKYADLRDCNYVVFEMFGIWRQYEEKAAFFENILERFEIWDGPVWPDAESDAYLDGLSDHLGFPLKDIPNAKEVVQKQLMYANIQRERALITSVIEFFKTRLGNFAGLVSFLKKDLENDHLVSIIKEIEGLHDELKNRLDELTAQLDGAVKVALTVPHAAMAMKDSGFLSKDEYGDLITHSSLTRGV